MATSHKDIKSLIKAILIARSDLVTDIDSIAADLVSDEFPKADIDQAVQEIKQAKTEAQERAHADAKNEYDVHMSAEIQRAQLEAEQCAKEEMQQRTVAALAMERKKNAEKTQEKTSGFMGWNWVPDWFGKSKTSPAAPTLVHEDIADFEDDEDFLETAFEQHVDNMKNMCVDINKKINRGLSITRQNLDNIFREHQKDDQIAVTIEIITRQLYRKIKKINRFKLDEKELSERLNILIQFFTANHIEKVMTELNQKLLKVCSEEFSVHTSSSGSPTALSPLILGPETLPSTVPSASPAMRSSSSNMIEGDSPTLTGIVKVNLVKNWFQRLVEVILEQKLPCPEVAQIDVFIESMKAKRIKKNLL